MVDLYKSSAADALNEEEYINKLYDNVQDKQKQLLMDAFTGNTQALEAEKQDVQAQTQTNLQRTDVEAQKAQDSYKPANMSGSIDQQVALTTGNQQKKNAATLKDAQAEADAEIERRRLLLGDQYAEAIKQAQAENNMIRAQQLYAEAKAADEQIRALKTEAGKLLAAGGDNSMLMSLLNGENIGTGTGGQTQADVLKYESQINDIYDNANAAKQAEAESTTAAILSQLQAQRQQQEKETGRKLTQTYVNALRQGKNQDEVQNASGLGSGNKAQAQLARAMGTTEDLTALRTAQTGADAAVGQQVSGAIADKNAAVADAITKNERDRVAELYGAAKDEENALIEQQQALGQILAKQGDYTVLGRLFGLTQAQIDKLNGKKSGGKSGGGEPPEEPPVEPTKQPSVMTGTLPREAVAFDDGTGSSETNKNLEQFIAGQLSTQAAIDALGKSEYNHAHDVKDDAVAALKKIFEVLPELNTKVFRA